MMKSIELLIIGIKDLDLRRRIVLLIIVLNFFGLVHFLSLSARAFYPGVYQMVDLELLAKLLIVYNTKALGASIVVFASQKTITILRHIIFFIMLAVLHSIAWALFHNDTLMQILRGSFVNFTGLIHLNLLFYFALLWFINLTSPTTEASATPAFLVRVNKDYVRLQKQEIRFIKADQNYVSINLIGNRKRVMVRKKISQVENELLADTNFVRIHRSYIVNTNFINELKVAENGVDMFCMIEGVGALPMSRKNKNGLVKRMASQINNSQVK